MFSISTAEIRWFFPGKIPGQAISWLRNKNGLFEEQAFRTDQYLLLPGQDNLGIKLREGRIEIKKRTCIHPEYSTEGVAGNLESWFKWSIPLEEGHNPFHSLMNEKTQWLGIRKDRSVQKYAIDESHGLMPHPLSGYPKEGVVIECSELAMGKQSWWTIALECFGLSDRVYTNLLSVIPELLSGGFPHPLSKAYSTSYPEWINKHK